MTEIYSLFILTFTANPLWQTMWIVAFIITMYAFGLCKDKQFIYIMMIGSLFWGLHFWLIAAFAAAWVQLFDIAKNALALRYEKNIKISIFCITAYIIIWFLAYKDAYSLLPIITSVISVFLVFYVRWIWLNLWYLWIIVCWFWYNLHNWSIGWMLSDVVLFFVWIAWVMRILIIEKKWKKSE